MILTAVNDAMRMADEDAANTMSRITNGLNLGGMGL
jgi:DNA-binding protein YbaB